MIRAIVAALAVLSLAACGDNNSKTPEPMEKAAKEAAPPAAEPMEKTAEAPAESAPAEPAATPEPMEETAEAPAASAPETAPTTTPSEAEPMEKAAEATPAAEPEPKAERTPSPAGAKVFFISPKDGDTIKGPIPVKFGVEGMEIVPAGTDQPNSGHYHLLIDTKLEDYDAPIPADDQHKHYGGGQTETAIGLAPGKHTLQILLGDKNHVPHDPPVESDVITITVE